MPDFLASPEPDDLDGAKSYVTFSSLGGQPVSGDAIRRELSRLPLDGVLGILGLVCVDAAKHGSQFYEPPHQAAWLNQAIVDDFPHPLPRASDMYAPGRVPITGERHLLVHQHNIAWLAHEAMLHCVTPSRTPDLPYELQRRCFRLLLIVNDLLAGPTHADVAPLTVRREVALEWLRLSQFAPLTNDIFAVMRRVARYWLLYRRFLPRHFAIDVAFERASGGISADLYYLVLAALLTHVFGVLVKDERPWVSKSHLFADLEAHQKGCAAFLARWTTTPQQYRALWAKWTASKAMGPGIFPGFDYVPLMTTPFVEARPNELVSPVLPFLFTKVVDDPYYLVTESLARDQQPLFQQALGRAYEDYAHALVRRILRGSDPAFWSVHQGPRGDGNEELADSYAQRGKTALVFEHKGQRPGVEFLTGGEGERVLGPSDELLRRLNAGESIGASEGRKHDHGLLTRGLWQQNAHASAIGDWAERAIGTRPTEILPVITHLADLRVDSVVRRAYLGPLIKAAGLYRDRGMENPEWLHVGDLEVLACFGRSGGLNFVEILRRKRRDAPNQRFDTFLGDVLRSLKPAIHLTVDTVALRLMKRAARTFWPSRTPPAQ